MSGVKRFKSHHRFGCFFGSGLNMLLSMNIWFLGAPPRAS
ncbi:hypothetical protein BAZMOX_148500_2 [methanotrophic endosymbiont of Bathymodiolus azoricus (Menez Gwen)]|nr:hypothetical protein BAZMOX_148500_2 [methanotrophic endosymbiont of Bathymodiolus azoricus (Menez Gwen)]